MPKFDTNISIKYYLNKKLLLKDLYGSSFNSTVRNMFDCMIQNNSNIHLSKIELKQKLISDTIQQYTKEMNILKQKYKTDLEYYQNEIKVLEIENKKLETTKEILLKLDNSDYDNQIFINIVDAYNKDVLTDNCIDYLIDIKDSSLFLTDFIEYLHKNLNKEVSNCLITDKKIGEIIKIISEVLK